MEGAITASGVEVVERARPGRGFEGIAHQDSYAMDDPPSEEVRLDPRFARAFQPFEPATELMDRQQLAAFGTPDSLTEDELDALVPPRPAPAELPADAFSEPTPSPMSRGWIVNPHAKDKGSEQGTGDRAPAAAAAADPATERISRDMLPPELLSEKTVPSPFANELLEVDDEPDAVAGAPRAEHTQPVETRDTQALDAPVPLSRANIPVLPSADLDAPTLERAARQLPADEPTVEEEEEPGRAGLPPLVGLVALVGSGGVIAGIGLGALVFALLFLFSRGGDESAPELALPPIEIDRDPVPTNPVADVATDPGDTDTPPGDTDAPDADGDTPEPSSPPSGDIPQRRRPKPVEPDPIVPEPPAPVVPAPVVERPAPVPVPEPEPEPERKGPFGRGKKK